MKITPRVNSFASNRNLLFILGVFIVAAAVVAVPYSVRSSSSPTEPSGNSKLSGTPAKQGQFDFLTASRSARSLSSTNFLLPVPQSSPETINTFAADCTTPQASFNLGETVCAITDGVDLSDGTYNVNWVSPTPTTTNGGTITTNPQSFLFSLPTSSTEAGLWKVNIGRTGHSTLPDDPAIIGDPPTFTVEEGAAMATFAANCLTPKTSFVLGEMVCARATGLVGFRIAWQDAAGYIEDRTDITTDPQFDTFTLPTTQTSVVDGVIVDNRGQWRANAITSRNSVKRSAFFTVTDPQNPVVDLSITKSRLGDNPQQGGQVQFLVRLTNNGPNDAANVHFVDDTFSGATFDSVTETSALGFVCTGSGSADCTITTLPAGSQATFLLNFTAGNAGNTVQNTAEVSSDTAEQNTLDNTFTTAAVLVGSGTPPPVCTLNCPNNINAIANTEENNQRGAHVDYLAPVVSDEDTCGTVTASPASGSFFPVGTTTVVATSASGNGSCSFTITVQDNTNGPTISCPPNKTADADSGACTATVDPGSPTTTGNSVTVTSQRSDGQPLNAPYPGGTTTIVWTATDDQDRTASCSQTITVDTDDATPPTITAPDDLTVFTGPEAQSCGLIVGESELGQATADDNCGNVNVSRTSVPSGNFFPVGTTTITYTATDGGGNTATDTQTITVTDNAPPIITATDPNPNPPPDTLDVPIQDVTVDSSSTSCDAVVSDADLGNVQVRDNCAGATLSRTPSGNTFPVGTTAITWSATDANGNTATALQNVTVNDVTLPTITAPADITAGTGPGRTSCDADVDLGTPSANDNCTFTVTHSPEGPYPLGTTTVTWTITDASGTATDTQMVTVTDTTVPTVTAPADSSASADASCQAPVPDYVAGTTASDNCDTSVTLTQSPAAGTMVGKGSHTVTVTGTDDAGNSNVDTVVFIVNDTTAPVISCPANITVYVALNSTDTSAVVTYPPATVSDNCPGATVGYSVASGSVFPMGSTTVTATATDSSGNTSSCSFTVTVLYNFTGFFSPVDNLPTLNVVNAGRAIPVKFSLSGNKGLNIFAANSPYTVSISCDGSAPQSDIEETLTAGGSSLSYNSTSDQYNYVWKTENSWAGTCRQLVVNLNDGSEHRANFKFK